MISTFSRLLLATAFLATASVHAVSPTGGDASFDGLVLPFKNVVVSSPVQSTIVAINVKEGDHVVAGDLLAHLYSRLEELDLLRAKADLDKKAFDARSSKNLYSEK